MPIVADTTAITDDEVEAFEDGKPLFVVPAPTFLSRWRVSGSWASGTTITESGYPTDALCDGYGDVVSRADVSADGGFSTIYLVGRFPDVTKLDAIALLGHNFDRFGGDLTISFEVADNQAYTSNLVELATVTPVAGDKRRIVWLNLDGHTRYTGVLYWRIKFVWTGPYNMEIAPELGEVVLGQRIQLGRRPNRVYDGRAVTGEVAQAVSKNGAVSKYVRFVNKGRIEATWSPYLGVDPGTGLDDFASFRTLHRRTGAGVGFFLYCDSPVAGIGLEASGPHDAMLMHLPQGVDFGLPEVDVNLSEVTLLMEEQPPFRATEAIDPDAPPAFTTSLYIADDEAHAAFGPVDGLDGETQALIFGDFKIAALGPTESHLLSLIRNWDFLQDNTVGFARHVESFIEADGSLRIRVGDSNELDWQSSPGLIEEGVAFSLGVFFDLANGTAANRIKVWKNKVAITPAAFTIDPYPEFGTYPPEDIPFNPNGLGCNLLLGFHASNGSATLATWYDRMGLWVGQAVTTENIEALHDDGLDASGLGDPDHRFDFEETLADTGTAPYALLHEANVQYDTGLR